MDPEPKPTAPATPPTGNYNSIINREAAQALAPEDAQRLAKQTKQNRGRKAHKGRRK